MQLVQLKLQNFKNYESTSLEFQLPIVCITGLNGAGKTNLLDAIHYLSTGKSAVNAIDSQNIKTKQPYFTIEGQIEGKNGVDLVFCGLAKGQKKILKVNNAEYKRLVEHYGKFPVVFVSPPDIALVTEGNEDRRKFIDSTISLYNDFYLDCLMQYNQIIVQRNAHLKEFTESKLINEKLIEVYNKQLDYLGNELVKERKAFLAEFNPVFTKMANAINAEKELLELRYNSQLISTPFLQLLRKNIDRDRILGRTDVGPHKDQWIFEINGQALKKFGSQGQQKSHLLALKLAKAAFVHSKTKKQPILLLDDVFDRLDDERVENLMTIIYAQFGQVFITDTSKPRLEKILKLCKIAAQYIVVANGKAQIA
ncbi:MAG: DNA replication/repair protein RecF [Bacteroidetes bacterium]|nr:DNA replication/repair protein RecF [Bacteroidota bacterium]